MTSVPGSTPDPDAPVPDADGLVRRSWAIGGAAMSALEGGASELRDGGGPAGTDVTVQRERVPPIVLLHGIPSSAEMWRGVMPALVAAGNHVVAFDLPGYGDTLLPARGDHSLGGAAELVATWVRIHGGGSAWVVGHDLGGAVAQIMASRHPTLLARLTLTDTVVEDSWPVAPIRRLRLLARAGVYPWLGTVHLLPNAWMWRELRRGFGDPSRLTTELADRVFWDGKVRDDAGRRAFARHLTALEPAQTVTAAGSLPRVPCPTQLVWGEHDQFQSWDDVGVRLQALLPDPVVTRLPAAGHFAPIEHPDAFARALLDWQP